MAYSIIARSDGNVSAREIANGEFLLTTYAAGDVLAVEYDGVNVRYLKNGMVYRTIGVAANQVLYFGTSVAGGSISNIRFGPLTNIAAVSAAAAAAALTANWATVTGAPTSLAALNSADGSKLSGIAAGATVGATWGSNLSGQPADNQILNNFNTAGIMSIPAPVGGKYAVAASGQVGALKIRLPQGWTNTMLRFQVQIFEYSTGMSCTYEVGGYTYVATSTWYNTYAKMVGGTAAAKTVRFGSDGSGYCCVWIGEPASTWQYPQFQVINFMGGYSNNAESQWASGWGVSLDTAAATNVSSSITGVTSGGAMAGIDQITVGNASTYIASAAIQNAQIGTAAVGLANINTATIGSLSALSANFGSASIASGGYLNSGQSAYATGTGFWLGSVSGVPKFSIGSSTNYMNWDGTNLNITGPSFDAFSCSITGGKAMHIDSGYRCETLNRAVNGAVASDHLLGYAADFICPDFGTPLEIVNAIVASEIQFDQCIQEGTWVHISFNPRMRREVLTAHFGAGGTTYTQGA
jgi:hypothetical protein